LRKYPKGQGEILRSKPLPTRFQKLELTCPAQLIVPIQPGTAEYHDHFRLLITRLEAGSPTFHHIMILGCSEMFILNLVNITADFRYHVSLLCPAPFAPSIFSPGE
jgi:hypothetical protein